MTEKLCIACDEPATGTIQETGSPHVHAYCMAHGEMQKRSLDSVLKAYTFTSIVATEPNEGQLLAQSYGQLETVHTENVGLRKAVAQLRIDWNICDQERQAHKVALGRAEESRDEWKRLYSVVTEQLASANELLDSLGVERPGVANERVEGSEVEPLPGVNAGSDTNRPPAKPEHS